MKVKTLLIAATLAGAALAAQAKDIVDTAVAAGNFKTLVRCAQGSRSGAHAQGQGALHGFCAHR